MIFNYATIAFALSVAVNALPQAYPNKCGDQVCPADRAKCCEVIINGVAELGCFAECPPVQALQRRQAYPNKCGDQVCPADKSKCCEVIVNGVAELGCFAECPPVQALQRREQPTATTAASPPVPTFGPKCGDSFFCPVGQVCCPNALYHCADPDKVSQQCPQQPTTTTAASPPIPTFGPKCGDSFFCPVGQVCCPNALYHCADPEKVSQQCPQ